MDALPFVKQILSQPALRVFLSNNFHVRMSSAAEKVLYGDISLTVKGLREGTEDEKLVLIENMQEAACKMGIMWRVNVRDGIAPQEITRLMRGWKKTQNSLIDAIVSYYYLKQTEAEGELGHNDIDAVLNSLDGIKIIEDFLLDKAERSNSITDKEKSRAVLLVIAFPALCNLKEPSKLLKFFFELSKELDNLPDLICKACEEQPMALLLIGRLLSLKQMGYNTWNKVNDELCKIRELSFDDSHNGATDDPTQHIFTCSYYDLPDILKPCFLYLACYPIDYEIPVKSLIELWIAEGFITTEEGETREEIAYKYLEQLVQRSLVCVSGRSFLGTIKGCRVHQSIHKLAIKHCYNEGFLAINPNEEEMKCKDRVVMHHDNNQQNVKLSGDMNIVSFLAFDFDSNIILYDQLAGHQMRVLQLRNSTILDGALMQMTKLRYLGLRGNNNIYELPENIGDMKKLRTLDVRDTKIETLPESLWKISKLRHVYINSNYQIKGPPSTATISDLQILKIVGVHESWLENYPQFLINLTKLSLSNREDLDWKSNPYWKSISILLSHMFNLLSLAIIGDIIPSEFADTRAFPNLVTVRSMKLVEAWSYKKHFIDNTKFPPNLVKLTLTMSHLKEDPMPALERLQILKYLRLQNGAYTGKKIVCSENGFPQLQFLELSKLWNLEIWEVKPMALSQLTTLHVLQCRKLINNLPDLEKVTDRLIR